MKREKGLARIFVLSYFACIFGGMLFGLLLVRFSVWLGIVMMIICLLDLAVIIVARCMFKNHYKTFLILSCIGFGLLTVLVVGAYIIEIIYSANKKAATYAWVIGSINLFFVAIIDFVYVRNLRRIHIDKLNKGNDIEVIEEEV